MMNKPKKWITLTPKWNNNGDFFGYDVIRSSHLWDDAGEIYEFVPLSEYENLRLDYENLQLIKQDYFENIQKLKRQK
jgi:hypothetical protein